MSSKFLSLIAGVSALALAGAAQAAGPMQLSDAQLDGVTAGAIDKHIQVIKVVVKADLDLKGDLAKSVGAAVANAPSSYHAFAYTDTYSTVDRDRHKVTAVALSESVAGVEAISRKRY